MSKKEQVTQIIFNTVDEINKSLAQDSQLEKSEQTILFGKDGLLDSLGLVNFIVTAEQKIKADTGKVIALADERAMSQQSSPLKTIGSLIDYTITLLENK